MGRPTRSRIGTVKMPGGESIRRPGSTGYEKAMEDQYQNLLQEYRDAADYASGFLLSDSSPEAETAHNRAYDLQRQLSDATRYRYAGTQWDPSQFYGSFPTLETGKLVESPDAADAANFYSTYAVSPGFLRIMENQRRWLSDNKPRKRYDGAEVLSYADRLHGMTGEGVFDVGLDELDSFADGRKDYGPVFLGTFPATELERKIYGDFPRSFLLGHELSHTVPFYGGVNGMILDTNRGAKKDGHDNRRKEKHADIQGMKYLLMKEGIYDARGEKDATIEDVKRLRERYPDLRPFQQMSDEQVVEMLNLVADNSSGVDMRNVSSLGGLIERYGAKAVRSALSSSTGRGFACGGRKFDGGGKFFVAPDIVPEETEEIVLPASVVPGFRTPLVSVPSLGLEGVPSETYEYSDSTYVPIYTSSDVAIPAVSLPSTRMPEPVSLFSDDAKARRRIKQMYTESGFNRKAVSKAGARGLFQIMPITEKDYLTRGKGRKGDVFDPAYNEEIRDYVFESIPKSLGEFWSDDESETNRLAKLYAAYNWGSGNLKKYLRKLRSKGVDTSDPDNWVPGLNDETRNYVTFLALDRDVPGTGMTNEKFEAAARRHGYMAEGGRLYREGGPEGESGFNAGAMLLKRLKRKYLSDYADNGYVYSYPSNPVELIGYAISPYAKIDRYGNEMLKEMPQEVTNARRALFAKNFGVSTDGKDYANAIVESKYRPSVSSDSNSKYYTIPIDDPKTRFEYLGSINGTAKYDFGEDEKGKYLSVYDIWDLAPFTDVGNNFIGATPPEIYDRFYRSEVPEIYDSYADPGFDTVIGSSNGMDFSSGGKIHIKPENRGKFTALKKRTGHSASWFKAHGTPAQKKMAVFALNSRKWKHGDGGPIDRYSPEQIRSAIAKLKETRK